MNRVTRPARWARWAGSLALAAAAWGPGAAAAPAADIDLHAFWDDRCLPCHGHAGEFARRTLAWRDGRLVGRHHDQDLPAFLRHHGVVDELVSPVMAMLAEQRATAPLYASACRDCHGTAAAFARRSLWIDEGVLRARRSGRPVADVLQRHGGLAADEQAALLATLTRVRGEVTD